MPTQRQRFYGQTDGIIGFSTSNMSTYCLGLNANSRHRRRRYVAGAFFILEMGDVLDCRESVNGSMSKQMVLVGSTCQVGLFIAQIEG